MRYKNEIMPKTTEKKNSYEPNFIVGIGGSAGSLDSYKALLDTLSSNTGMAFVIVSHLMPTAKSKLAEILSSHTKMPVKVASSAISIQANHIYVIPPDADLLIEHFTFKVVTPRTIRNKQIDYFLISLSEAIGARAIAVILSGYDGDGTEGCQHIKAKGGTTFVQDMSAEVPHMPLSALDSGSVDFILPPNKISDKLKKMAAALKT